MRHIASLSCVALFAMLLCVSSSGSGIDGRGHSGGGSSGSSSSSTSSVAAQQGQDQHAFVQPSVQTAGRRLTLAEDAGAVDTLWQVYYDPRSGRPYYHNTAYAVVLAFRTYACGNTFAVRVLMLSALLNG